MPNTLVHIAMQVPASRLAFVRIPVTVILLGCIIPDLPWIMRRGVLWLYPAVDPFLLMQYAAVQATLLSCLIFCAVLACLTHRWAVTWAVLAINSLLHLLLDAIEIKPGNGVHLTAPWSWELLSFGLVWPDSMIIIALTVVGLCVGVWILVSASADPGIAKDHFTVRVGFIFLLLLIYFFGPLAFMQGPYEADNYSMRTLHETNKRVGGTVRLDRRPYLKTDDGNFIITFAGQKLRLVGDSLPLSANASVVGVFIDENSVKVQQIHQGQTMLRDFSSYAGLLVILIAWVMTIRRMRSPP